MSTYLQKMLDTLDGEVVAVERQKAEAVQMVNEAVAEVHRLDEQLAEMASLRARLTGAEVSVHLTGDPVVVGTAWQGDLAPPSDAPHVAAEGVDLPEIEAEEDRQPVRRSPEAFRDWIVATRDRAFTNAEFAKEFGFARAERARAEIDKFIERGMVVVVAEAHATKSAVFRYVKPVAPTSLAEHRDTKEARKGTFGGHGAEAGTGSTGRASSSHVVKEILRSVSDQVTIDGSNGHIRVTCKATGRSTSISHTPSDMNAGNAIKRDLRAIGVRV